MVAGPTLWLWLRRATRMELAAARDSALHIPGSSHWLLAESRSLEKSKQAPAPCLARRHRPLVLRVVSSYPAKQRVILLQPLPRVVEAVVCLRRVDDRERAR